MKKIKTVLNYFTNGELILWFVSVLLVVLSFIIWDKVKYLNLIASLVGVTSLIFNAKGNPFGQILIIVFSILYGIISYTFAYFGEMITYLGMTAPMAFIAFISWVKNPYSKGKVEVKINELKIKEYFLMFILTSLVTTIFYFILKLLNTTNIIPSTISIATSFIAVYLTFKRSEYYCIAYAANDAVLVVLWVYASLSNVSYLSVTVCFLVMFVNDIYGFINWTKMKKRQQTKDINNL